MARRKKAKIKEKTIASIGPHGRKIRVWQEGDVVKVQCRHLDRRTKSFRGAGAEDLAMAVARELKAKLDRQLPGSVVDDGPPSLSLDALWALYTGTSAYRELRARSKQLYHEGWKVFTLVVPGTTIAESITPIILEQVRTRLEETATEKTKKPRALASIRRIIGTVRIVFGWAERNELIKRNRLHAFKFRISKDRRPVSPAEYTDEEFVQIMGSFNPAWAKHRTPATILGVLGNQGARINAVVHLDWRDVDWDTVVRLDDGSEMRGLFIWRAQWDKMGNEWDQPMRQVTRDLLQVWWRLQGCPTEGWVFPTKNSRSQVGHFSVIGFLAALTTAEIRAGVTHQPMRGSHGFRRRLSGNVADATGSLIASMQAIGNRDVRMAARYVKPRRGRTALALASLDAGDHLPRQLPANKQTTEEAGGKDEG